MSSPPMELPPPTPQPGSDTTAVRAGVAIAAVREAIPRMNARSAALVLLAVLAPLFALRSARDFIVPLVIAIIIAYALDPLVTAMARRRIHRAVGSTLVLMALLAGIAAGSYAIRGQVQSIVDG